MRAALAVPSEVVQFLRISNAGIIVIVIVIIVVGLHAASSLAKASATVHTHTNTLSHTGDDAQDSIPFFNCAILAIHTYIDCHSVYPLVRLSIG